MELFPPLTGFYQAIEYDSRIGTTHISLYMSLLQQWNLSGGSDTVIIKRDAIMKAAKINARFTYNKCMNDLEEFGYIIYIPTTNQFDHSYVTLKYLQNRK
jgi:hypothetical protein